MRIFCYFSAFWEVEPPVWPYRAGVQRISWRTIALWICGSNPAPFDARRCPGLSAFRARRWRLGGGFRLGFAAGVDFQPSISSAPSPNLIATTTAAPRISGNASIRTTQAADSRSYPMTPGRVGVMTFQAGRRTPAKLRVRRPGTPHIGSCPPRNSIS